MVESDQDPLVHRIQEYWSSTDGILRTKAAIFKLVWEGGLSFVVASLLVGGITLIIRYSAEISIELVTGLVGAWVALFIAVFRRLFCNLIVRIGPEEPESDTVQTELES